MGGSATGNCKRMIEYTLPETGSQGERDWDGHKGFDNDHDGTCHPDKKPSSGCYPKAFPYLAV